MIVFAHLGHWYSAFGFLVPAALVIAWIRYQARRDRRRVLFVEHWTLVLRDGVWVLESVRPAPPPPGLRRARRAKLASSPWCDNGAQAVPLASPPGAAGVPEAQAAASSAIDRSA